MKKYWNTVSAQSVDNVHKCTDYNGKNKQVNKLHSIIKSITARHKCNL